MLAFLHRREFAFWPLGLLPFIASVFLIALFSQIVELKITKAQTDLEAIDTALDIYKTKHGDYPNESAGLSALTDGKDPLIPRLPKDPWTSSYRYHHAPGITSYILYSPGVDHRDDGGQGDDVIAGPKEYRCADYGVNCPPTPGQIGAWPSLALAAFSVVVGIIRAVTMQTPPRQSRLNPPRPAHTPRNRGSLENSPGKYNLR